MDNPEKLATQATQDEEDLKNEYATQYANIDPKPGMSHYIPCLIAE
jgi:hypothetical protein